MQLDLEITLLRSFIAVAKRRNFSQAAVDVGRTQSAISLQIKRLEEIVGERLFKRTPQSVSLTPAGETLLVYAHRILETNDAALAHIKRPEAAGVVRLGVPEDYAVYLLPPILSALAESHPRIRIEVSCDNSCALLPMLDDGSLDVVVATHAINDVKGRIARYEPLHWVAAPSYVDDPEQPLSMALFPPDCVCRDAALNALQSVSRDWHVAYSTRSISLIERAVLDGAAVSVMESFVIPEGLRILDGQPGFPTLSDIAISVHIPSAAPAHVALVGDFFLSSLAKANPPRVLGLAAAS